MIYDIIASIGRDNGKYIQENAKCESTACGHCRSFSSFCVEVLKIWVVFGVCLQRHEHHFLLRRRADDFGVGGPGEICYQIELQTHLRCCYRWIPWALPHP